MTKMLNLPLKCQACQFKWLRANVTMEIFSRIFSRKKAFYCFMHKHKSHERNGEIFYVLKSYNVCYLSSISPSYACMDVCMREFIMHVSQEPSNWFMMQILSAQKWKEWRNGEGGELG